MPHYRRCLCPKSCTIHEENDMICKECGGRNVVILIGNYQYGDTLIPGIKQERCYSCGSRFLLPGQSDKIQKWSMRAYSRRS